MLGAEEWGAQLMQAGLFTPQDLVSLSSPQDFPESIPILIRKKLAEFGASAPDGAPAAAVVARPTVVN